MRSVSQNCRVGRLVSCCAPSLLRPFRRLYEFLKMPISQDVLLNVAVQEAATRPRQVRLRRGRRDACEAGFGSTTERGVMDIISVSVQKVDDRPAVRFEGAGAPLESKACVNGSRWQPLRSPCLRPTSSLPQRVITTSSLCTLALTASLSFACREGTEPVLKVSRLKTSSRADTTSIELQSSVGSFAQPLAWCLYVRCQL